jgi:hypothetical protein
MSDLSVRYIWGIRFDLISRELEYAFTSLFICLSPSWLWPKWHPVDLLPLAANLHDPLGGLFPSSDRLSIGFVLPLLYHDNFIVFNLVFSFLSFFYIASQFLWSRYSYDRSVKCFWVLGRFKRDQYSSVVSYFLKSQLFPSSVTLHWYTKETIKKPYDTDGVGHVHPDYWNMK